MSPLSGGLSIRDGRPSERAALENLQRRAALMWDEHRSYLLANPDAIALPLAQLLAGQVRVAEHHGAVTGFSAVLPAAGHFALDGLFVEPSQWRQGVGRALVMDALGRLPGGTRLEVVANPRAEGFYDRLGFSRFATVQTQFGPAWRMAWAAA